MSGQQAVALAPPPRRVPLLTRSQLFFGGTLNQFGWVLVGFGMILVWAFAVKVDVTSWYLFRGPLAEASGVVTQVEQTRASRGGRRVGRRAGGQRVGATYYYANYYRFADAQGVEHEGVSYSLGERVREGMSIVVEYPQGRPQYSRIRGFRRGLFPTIVLFVVIFPFLGMVVVVGGLRRGWRASHLLAHGRMAKGKLLDKVFTGTGTVYKYTFEFTADDGQSYRAAGKTDRIKLLEDEEQERLLYDPARPSYAAMLDGLPGAAEITSAGHLRARSPARGLLVLLIPALTVLGHGAYVWFRYFA